MIVDNKDIDFEFEKSFEKSISKKHLVCFHKKLKTQKKPKHMHASASADKMHDSRVKYNC